MNTDALYPRVDPTYPRVDPTPMPASSPDNAAKPGIDVSKLARDREALGLAEDGPDLTRSVLLLT